MDSDIKELIYKSLKRAVVEERDIAAYNLIWKKHRIYVANEYQQEKATFKSQEDWDKSVSYLNPDQIPSEIGDVRFCLKSNQELQKIANRTWEDFLHISYDLIKINGDKAIVRINNWWMSSKHSKVVYLSGGGYESIYRKIDGVWKFERKTSSWQS